MSSNGESNRVSSGGACAAMLACGIGVCLFGVMVVLAEANSDAARVLNLIQPVGPLSGKVAVGLVVWLSSWGLLHKLWANRPIDFGKVRWLATALIVAGFALTFPPVFSLFAH